MTENDDGTMMMCRATPPLSCRPTERPTPTLSWLSRHDHSTPPSIPSVVCARRAWRRVNLSRCISHPSKQRHSSSSSETNPRPPRSRSLHASPTGGGGGGGPSRFCGGEDCPGGPLPGVCRSVGFLRAVGGRSRSAEPNRRLILLLDPRAAPIHTYKYKYI